ncbi:MAG: hypothetical protein AAGF15_11670 [Pseudomonadota bacterium]
MELNLVAVGLYSVAGLGGMIMAIRAFGGQGSPTALAVLHLLFALAGAGTLYAYISSGDVDQKYTIALGLYGAAALGGLFLGSFRFRKDGKMPPNAIVGVHALVAVAGTFVLVTAVFA